MNALSIGIVVRKLSFGCERVTRSSSLFSHPVKLCKRRKKLLRLASVFLFARKYSSWLYALLLSRKRLESLSNSQPRATEKVLYEKSIAPLKKIGAWRAYAICSTV